MESTSKCHREVKLLYLSHETYELTINSYGTLFMGAIKNAADIARLGGDVFRGGYGDEDLSDKTFNFRLPGLNADFMSYATYALAQKNPLALLDPSTLEEFTNTAFSVFFQHYAATDVSMTTGGRVFQPIGAELPFGLPPIVDGPSIDGGLLSPHQIVNVPSTSNRSVEAVVHRRVEQLVMSPAAVILCLIILAFLTCIAVLVYFPYSAHFKALPRDVETLASAIAFVYDSPKLQHWLAANEHLLDSKAGGRRFWNRDSARRGTYKDTAMTEGQDQANSLDEMVTGLGFFRGEQGVARWGVEIEPVVHADPKTPYTALVANETE